VASKFGHPENPAWFHNARANPDVMLGGRPHRAGVVEDGSELACLELTRLGTSAPARRAPVPRTRGLGHQRSLGGRSRPERSVGGYEALVWAAMRSASVTAVTRPSSWNLPVPWATGVVSTSVARARSAPTVASALGMWLNGS
jgi:hypothetical protein